MSKSVNYALAAVVCQVRYATDWIVGGYENSVTDGYMNKSDVPSWSDMREEILFEMEGSTFAPGCQSPGAIPELELFEQEFILRLIDLHEAIYQEAFA